MKPSLIHLAIVLGNTAKPKRCVLYKNGTFVMIFEDDKQSIDDSLNMFKKINRPSSLVIQSSSIFDDHSAYYCFYDEYSSVCLFCIEDQGGVDRHVEQIKKEMLNNFEEDMKSQ